MDKALILINASKDDPFIKEWEKNELATDIIFNPVNKFLRGIRRIWIKLGFPFQQIWYGKIQDQINKYDLIIVHMSSLTMNLCQYINKLNPNAKVIGWYWNRVYNNTLPSLQKGKYEAWSFDPNDCKKYGFRFNHQYYFKSMMLPTQNAEWDVYFCGLDSGRGNEIVRMYDYFNSKRITSKFQVVEPQNEQIPKSIVSERVNYDEVRLNIAKSNAILEILRKGQSGPTLRTMEAIYFQKKLITNNLSVKDEEFYSEDRIFIYTERSMNELEDFLNKEFVPYDDELMDKYDVKQWIKNFTEGK